jgi:hypothetical protein
MLTVLSARMEEKRGDDFLRINDNIQNEDLRMEMETLREEFNSERTRIREYYHEQMEALKSARRSEMKTMKVDFSERKDVLLKKYVGKKRKKTNMKSNKPVENSSRKMKPPRDKRKKRKY